MAKKILIVDDEADIRTYLQVLFEENGYETAVAVDGDVAMAKAREFKPDAITLDIIMPHESGQKFYRQLAKDPELSKIPVVICTGMGRYRDLFERDHRTMPRPLGFIEKPIDKDELLKKIMEAVG